MKYALCRLQIKSWVHEFVIVIAEISLHNLSENMCGC